MQTIGKNLKEIRIKNNLSQKELSELSGLSIDYISKLELNKKGNPSMNSLLKLSTALNCTVDDLTRNTEEDNEKNIYEMIEEILKKNNMHNEETQVAALLLAKLRSNNLINEDFEMTPSLVKLLEEAIRLDAKIEKNIKNAEDE
ncbi:MAG: Helix-turn-helix domain [Anaerocolumna sp.]|jgi:transcriptional regulator with XRE-family HTH domain|nr:Helix-turn-helix domain [Anaerocolumna sp.]